MKSFHTRFLSACALGCSLALIGSPALAADANGDSAGDKVSAAADETSRVVSDSWITTKVKTELATTDGVKSTDISVKTKDGVVTLTGLQENNEAVKKAVAVAASIKGVTRVDDAGLKVDQ